VRQWKIAVSVAVVGAIASPFLGGTWNWKATQWVSLDAETRARLAAIMDRTENCGTYDRSIATLEMLGLRPAEDDVIELVTCHRNRQELLDEGHGERRFSPLQYLAVNALVLAGSFLAVFAVAMAIPFAFRRWWHWLKA
jgi:hypothetical protein